MFFKDVTRLHIYSLITYSDLNQQQTQATQARARLDYQPLYERAAEIEPKLELTMRGVKYTFFFVNLYANVQRNVTCGVYYYIPIEFDYAKRDSSLAAYGGVGLYGNASVLLEKSILLIFCE